MLVILTGWAASSAAKNSTWNRSTKLKRCLRPYFFAPKVGGRLERLGLGGSRRLTRGPASRPSSRCVTSAFWGVGPICGCNNLAVFRLKNGKKLFNKFNDFRNISWAQQISSFGLLHAEDKFDRGLKPRNKLKLKTVIESLLALPSLETKTNFLQKVAAWNRMAIQIESSVLTFLRTNNIILGLLFIYFSRNKTMQAWANWGHKPIRLMISNNLSASIDW